ncbi:MAG: DNA-processing protein DprA, partial [Caldisericaceae bacterium]
MKTEEFVALNLLRFTAKDNRIASMINSFENKKTFEPDFTADEMASARKEIASALNLGVEIIPYDDDGFPSQLRDIKESPLVIYIKGSLEKTDSFSVSIVGSRKCTEYGKAVARELSKKLAQLGIAVVSGLAYGIDSEAHKGALSVNGRTVAVLGSGVDVVYPRENRFLYDEIVEKGAVISEFPLGTKALKFNFPFRNRIISGLSLATIVVEAQEKSGSLITANYALEQSREVFAVPGNITSSCSKGTNLLIRDGAIPLLSYEDVLYNVKEFQS